MARWDEMEKDFRDYEARIQRLKEVEPVVQTLEKADLPSEIKEQVLAVKRQLKAPLKADWVDQQMSGIKGRLAPVITITSETGALQRGIWTDVTLVIRNAGAAAARNISVSSQDSVEIEGTLHVEELPAGGQKRLPIRIRCSSVSDRLDLLLTAVAEDIFGSKHSYRQKVSFEIAESPGVINAPAKEATTPVPARPAKAFEPQPTGISTFPPEMASLYYDAVFIGRGGFARVFRARRKLDNRIVAVKLPLALDEGTGRGFIREIRVWEDLKHENIVECFDCNVLPVPYLELEYMEEGSLEDFIAKYGRPLPVPQVISIGLGIARGLKYSHSIPPNGIIHRDLKPGNVLLSGSLVPKITDWGLSKVVAESKRSTRSGFAPLYAAPEQISAKKFGPADKRTDIYQLGVILYEMATARTPFRGDDIAEVMSQIINEEPEPPSNINPEAKTLEPLILKCIAKKKEERYQRIEDVETALLGCLRNEYAQSLALSQGDGARSAYFTAQLFLLNIREGDAAAALQYCIQMKEYLRDSRDIEELADELRYLADRGLGVSEALRKRAEAVAGMLTKS